MSFLFEGNIIWHISLSAFTLTIMQAGVMSSPSSVLAVPFTRAECRGSVAFIGGAGVVGAGVVGAGVVGAGVVGADVEAVVGDTKINVL